MWESCDNCLDASERLESCSYRYSLGKFYRFESVIGKESGLHKTGVRPKAGSCIGRTVPDHVYKRAAGWHVLVASVVKETCAIATS